MFEVVVRRADGAVDVYDGLSEMQAQCIFFRSRAQPDVTEVTLNQFVE